MESIHRSINQSLGTRFKWEGNTARPCPPPTPVQTPASPGQASPRASVAGPTAAAATQSCIFSPCDPS